MSSLDLSPCDFCNRTGACITCFQCNLDLCFPCAYRRHRFGSLRQHKFSFLPFSRSQSTAHSTNSISSSNSALFSSSSPSSAALAASSSSAGLGVDICCWCEIEVCVLRCPLCDLYFCYSCADKFHCGGNGSRKTALLNHKIKFEFAKEVPLRQALQTEIAAAAQGFAMKSRLNNVSQAVLTPGARTTSSRELFSSSALLLSSVNPSPSRSISAAPILPSASTSSSASRSSMRAIVSPSGLTPRIEDDREGEGHMSRAVSAPRQLISSFSSSTSSPSTITNTNHNQFLHTSTLLNSLPSPLPYNSSVASSRRDSTVSMASADGDSISGPLSVDGRLGSTISTTGKGVIEFGMMTEEGGEGILVHSDPLDEATDLFHSPLSRGKYNPAARLSQDSTGSDTPSSFNLLPEAPSHSHSHSAISFPNSSPPLTSTPVASADIASPSSRSLMPPPAPRARSSSATSPPSPKRSPPAGPASFNAFSSGLLVHSGPTASVNQQVLVTPGTPTQEKASSAVHLSLLLTPKAMGRARSTTYLVTSPAASSSSHSTGFNSARRLTNTASTYKLSGYTLSYNTSTRGLIQTKDPPPFMITIDPTWRTVTIQQQESGQLSSSITRHFTSIAACQLDRDSSSSATTPSSSALSAKESDQAGRLFVISYHDSIPVSKCVTVSSHEADIISSMLISQLQRPNLSLSDDDTLLGCKCEKKGKMSWSYRYLVVKMYQLIVYKTIARTAVSIQINLITSKNVRVRGAEVKEKDSAERSAMLAMQQQQQNESGLGNGLNVNTASGGIGGGGGGSSDVSSSKKEKQVVVEANGQHLFLRFSSAAERDTVLSILQKAMKTNLSSDSLQVHTSTSPVSPSPLNRSIMTSSPITPQALIQQSMRLTPASATVGGQSGEVSPLPTLSPNMSNHNRSISAQPTPTGSSAMTSSAAAFAATALSAPNSFTNAMLNDEKSDGLAPLSSSHNAYHSSASSSRSDSLSSQISIAGSSTLYDPELTPAFGSITSETELAALALAHQQHQVEEHAKNSRLSRRRSRRSISRDYNLILSKEKFNSLSDENSMTIIGRNSVNSKIDFTELLAAEEGEYVKPNFELCIGCYQLMRSLHESMKSGCHLTPILYVPRIVWYQHGVKFQAFSMKLEAFEMLKVAMAQLMGVLVGVGGGAVAGGGATAVGSSGGKGSAASGGRK